MEEIKSVKNPTVRWMRTLRERKGREESGAFLVEGRKMIEEARNAGLRALCLLAVEELREFAAGFDRAALVPDFVLEAVCDTKTPQGACAAFEMPKTIPLEAAPERLVALDGVQDPGNVGGPFGALPTQPRLSGIFAGSGMRGRDVQQGTARGNGVGLSPSRVAASKSRRGAGRIAPERLEGLRLGAGRRGFLSPPGNGRKVHFGHRKRGAGHFALCSRTGGLPGEAPHARRRGVAQRGGCGGDYDV